MTKLRIKEIAQQRGLSISALMRKANQIAPDAPVSYPTVWGAWHNKTEPSLNTLLILARALDVEIGDLIAEDTEETDVPGLAVAW
jgi:transcriptional regulator with XRE-family HTH domain